MKNMKKLKLLLFVTLCLIPTIVFAGSGSDDFGFEVALFMEAFVTIHMSVFVLKPLANIFGGTNSNSLFIKLFIARIVILLIGNFITSFTAIMDFFAVFLGAFIIVPICSAITKKPAYGTTKTTTTTTATTKTNNLNIAPQPTKKIDVVLKCNGCGSTVSVTDKFCLNCGIPMTGDNLKVEQSATGEGVVVPPKVRATIQNYDPIFNYDENTLLEEFLNRELTKASIDKTAKLIPEDALKRKKILSVIYAVLLFIFISMIFFHYPLLTYIVGIIILFIFFKITTKYNLIKYLVKEVKSRPQEKISNIVMGVKNSFVKDNSTGILIIGILVAIISPILIFWNPRIIYEEAENGYAVRYYAFGVTNFTTAEIPKKHNGEKVVSLRGNTFSNMPFLREVKLPDTIVEIRGQAFMNTLSLEKVKLPKNLKYLGGEAFMGASSLKEIEIPEGVPEIKGSTFENCTSLEKVTIPDSVVRIGGHAFRGDSNLREVILTEKSQLNEIGSSAFRVCTSLYEITLPRGVSINERAFKESPTRIKYFGEEDDYYYDDYYNDDNYYYDDYYYENDYYDYD